MTSISILMPVYNGGFYIQEAVESVLSQDYPEWELIISDDGSVDGTRDYLDALSDPRIRIYKQERNLGIFGNLNFLLKKARYPIAKIFCQDDRLLEGALKRILLFMEARPNCAVSRCWAKGDAKKYMPGGGAEIEGALPIRIEPSASTLAFAAFGNLVGNLSKAACRPELILEAGGFDQNYPYSGDYEAWARVSGCFGLDLQNEELVFVRNHELQNSVLLNRKNELYPQMNRLINKFATQVDSDDLVILKRHWTIHFFCQRLSRIIRSLLSGNLSFSTVPLQDLPLDISPMDVLAAYPFWKFNLPGSQTTTRWLFNRILELNDVTKSISKRC